MLGFIKRFSRGNKFMNLLATEIGVDPQIYKADLTEMNLNFAAFNAMYEAEASTEPNERRLVARFAQMSLEGAFEGAKRIKQRFPTESSIDDFILSLGRYTEQANSANDDDLPDLGEPPLVCRRVLGSNVRLLFHVGSRFDRTSPLLHAA